MSNYKIDCETVMRAAKGRWDEILSHLAPVLQPALEAAPKHVTCPILGERTALDSSRITRSLVVAFAIPVVPLMAFIF